MNTGETAIPFPLLEPWTEIENSAEACVSELKKELGKSHVLYGCGAEALARRVDCDDALFKINGKKECLAVVHLTWSGKQEKDARWPSTEIYEDFEEWRSKCLIPDHEDYVD